ncbi:hypothetical protein ABZP36_009988 [Zizania latifolia]
MAMGTPGQRRQEFSFHGTAAAGGGDQYERVRLPRPPGNPMAARKGEEESRWLQASRIGSPESASGGSGSGTPSPQFWGHHHGQYQQIHRLYPASAGSSPSRAQAIAGYRREMLDLVRGLPESAYELSLRDIVESPPAPPLPLPRPPPPSNTANATAPQPPPQKQPRAVGEAKIAAAAAGAMDEEASMKQSKKQGKASGKARKQRTMGRTRSRSLERNVSLDTGLLIKLFLPLSVGGKKKVSPNPPTAAGGKDGKKKTKKPWKKQEVQDEVRWKKDEFIETTSSSRTSSTNSTNSSSSSGNGGHGHGSSNSNSNSSSRNVHGSSNPKAPTRSISRKRIGCYGFFRPNKSRNGGTQD